MQTPLVIRSRRAYWVSLAVIFFFIVLLANQWFLKGFTSALDMAFLPVGFILIAMTLWTVPMLRLDETVVIVQNPLLTYRLPWAMLDDVELQWGLLLRVGSQKIPVWAIPPASSMKFSGKQLTAGLPNASMLGDGKTSMMGKLRENDHLAHPLHDAPLRGTVSLDAVRAAALIRQKILEKSQDKTANDDPQTARAQVRPTYLVLLVLVVESVLVTLHLF